MLQVCRRIYPSFRVDLTELFSKQFVAQGHSIDWMMQSSDEYRAQWIIINAQERILLGRSVTAWGVLSQPINKIFTFLHDLRVLPQALKDHYDIIQVRDKTFASIVGLLACRLTDAKLVYWMSYTFVEADQINAGESWRNRRYFKAAYLWCRYRITAWLLYKIIIPKADHTFVQSDRMLTHVAAKGAFGGKLTTVPMGVSDDDMELTIAVKQDLRLKGKIPMVYLGTMIAIRKIDFFIYVLEEVKKAVPNAVLLLIGDGSKNDMAQLKQVAMSLSLQEQVIFTGFIDRHEAWRYIKACRVGMAALPPNPVLDTCSPTKAVEYMALEVPSVVNDVGDQGAIVREANAGLVAKYEPKDFAEAVVRLMTDDTLHASMAKNGRPYVFKNRTYSHLGSRLQSKYLEILAQPKGTVSSG